MRTLTLLVVVGLTWTVCAENPNKKKPTPRPLTPQEKQINESLKKNYYYNGGPTNKDLEREQKENAQRAKAAVESNYDGIFGEPKYKTPDANSSRPAAPPGAVRNAVHKAAAKGDLEGLKALIEGGADPGEADSQGNTALHLSAGQGDWKMVDFLLGRGVAVGQANYRGETPLHLAARRGALEVGEALIRAGAPLQARSFEGKTPLDLVKACTQGSARELEAALTKATQ